jgi:hypothetical protein
MSLKARLLEIAKSVPAELLEFKEYGKQGRKMATTRTVNVVDQGPVPGHEGKVGRYQITFCLNIMDIANEADYKARQDNAAVSALDAMTPDQRRELLAKYAAEIA